MHLASGGHLLPEHDVVVFDEAHELEDIAATSLGLELSAGRFEALARMIGDLVVGGPQGLADPTLAAGVALAEGRVQVLSAALRRAEVDQGSEVGARKSRAQQAAGHLKEDLGTVAALPTSHVAWVEKGVNRQPVLRVAAVEVGAILARQLWGEVSAVLTSATIPPGIVARLGLPPTETDELDVGT